MSYPHQPAYENQDNRTTMRVTHHHRAYRTARLRLVKPRTRNAAEYSANGSSWLEELCRAIRPKRPKAAIRTCVESIGVGTERRWKSRQKNNISILDTGAPCWGRAATAPSPPMHIPVYRRHTAAARARKELSGYVLTAGP